MSAPRRGAPPMSPGITEDVLEIHPHDAEVRGIRDGAMVSLSSRIGATTLRAVISDRMPQGVVYTTFHHPVTGANVITTEIFRLGHQLPRIQGDRGAGDALQPAFRLAEWSGSSARTSTSAWR